MPFALNAVAFAVGAWLLQQQPQLPSFLWSYALLAAFFGYVLLARMEGSIAQLLHRILLPLLFLAAGFLWSAGVAHVRLADELGGEWEGRDVELVGVVADLPQAGERGVRFRFDVERVVTPLAHIPTYLSLTWYAERVPTAGADRLQTRPIPELRPGQRWMLTVRLRRPHGTANPNGFDSEMALLERGIRAVGYVRSNEPSRPLASMVGRPAYWVERLRERARTRIYSALPGDPAAGVLVALAIGDQQAIAASQWTVFTRTGVNHLMSISGLHITMVAGLGFGAVLFVWRRVSAFALRFPAQKAAAVAGLVVAFGYALLSGYEVPAQRTVYMLAVVAGSLALGVRISALDILATALLVVLMLDPWAVMSAGFWLSFGAVALIMYVNGGRLAPPGWLENWARIQWAITIGLVPLLIVLFQQVSIVSPIANALAIPLVSLLVVPLTLLGLVLPWDLLLVLAAKLMMLCDLGLQALSRLPAAVWEQHAPVIWAVPVAVLGMLWLLAPRGFPARWLGLAGFLPLLAIAPETPRAPQVWIDVLDVGQGLAVVVRTANHSLLYDTGPAYSSDSDSGSRIVVPFLRAAGITHLDGVIVSHDDIDHSGGLLSVLQALPVDWVATSLPQSEPALALAARSQRCFAGQQWEWDGVRFEILHPTWDSYNEPTIKDNDRGCVLRVVCAAGTVLLAADIERQSEQQLLQRVSQRLPADVLIVPHHGSMTSSSDAFLDRVQPKIAIIPVGYRNRFGHPAADVLARYQRLGARIFRTDRDGALLVRFDDSISVRAWRLERPRYWQGR